MKKIQNSSSEHNRKPDRNTLKWDENFKKEINKKKLSLFEYSFKKYKKYDKDEKKPHIKRKSNTKVEKMSEINADRLLKRRKDRQQVDNITSKIKRKARSGKLVMKKSMNVNKINNF